MSKRKSNPILDMFRKKLQKNCFITLSVKAEYHVTHDRQVDR